jgi:zinc D-Ala-D-Ala dipeptidase
MTTANKKYQNYHCIPIQDCNETLVHITSKTQPLDVAFSFFNPHEYSVMGAKYTAYSPYHIRSGVLDRLIIASTYLYNKYKLRLHIFDAYRPLSVQQYMVDYTYSQIKQANPQYSDEQIINMVFRIWAYPSIDIKTPPPHSTGAAIDLTLVDEHGRIIDMGGAIDEISDRSLPDYYINEIKGSIGQVYHTHRKILSECMIQAGFWLNGTEWWHFSYGDQMWAYNYNQDKAIYGRVD